MLNQSFRNTLALGWTCTIYTVHRLKPTWWKWEQFERKTPLFASASNIHGKSDKLWSLAIHKWLHTVIERGGSCCLLRTRPITFIFDLDLFELDLFLKWNYFTQIYLKLIKYNLDSGRGTAKVTAKHTWIRFSTLNLLPNTGGAIWGEHIKDS